MPRRKIPDVEMQAVAYLYSQKYSREDIKHILHLSQSTVSRSIQRALEAGWLETNVRFVTEHITPERMQEIEALVSPQHHLTEHLHAFAHRHGVLARPHIRVFPNAPQPPTSTAQATPRDWFGHVAAGYIRDLLRPSQVCGVSWGYMLASVVRGLRTLGPPPLRKGPPIEFVPLCGEPLDTAITQYSSSGLAAQLDEALNGGTEHSRPLAAVPALIPEEFTPREVQVIRRLIGHVTAYREIFQGREDTEGQQAPWIDQLDTILTGIGSAETSLRYWDDALVRTGGIDRDRLSGLVLGDISGVLFARPNLSPSQQAELTRIEERWTGIREPQMQRCAERAFHQGTPGVIVVAVGADRAESVCESIKRGLINTLVIDRALADALLQVALS
jgi:DNA-binding transcriptional regulator LsrR (DeoR family)